MSTAPPTTAPPSDARVTQILAEVLRNVPDVVSKVTQVEAEILRKNAVSPRVSQVVVEVLRERPPYDTTPAPTTTPPTTLAPTTLAPTTAGPTTAAPTAGPTTTPPTTTPPTTAAPTTLASTAPPVWTAAPLTYPAPTGYPTTQVPPGDGELLTTVYPDVARPLLCRNDSPGVTVKQVCVEVPAFIKTALVVTQFGPELFIGRLTELPTGQPDDSFPPDDIFPPGDDDTPDGGSYPYDAIGFIPDDVSSKDVGNR